VHTFGVTQPSVPNPIQRIADSNAVPVNPEPAPQPLDGEPTITPNSQPFPPLIPQHSLDQQSATSHAQTVDIATPLVVPSHQSLSSHLCSPPQEQNLIHPAAHNSTLAHSQHLPSENSNPEGNQPLTAAPIDLGTPSNPKTTIPSTETTNDSTPCRHNYRKPPTPQLQNDPSAFTPISTPIPQQPSIPAEDLVNCRNTSVETTCQDKQNTETEMHTQSDPTDLPLKEPQQQTNSQCPSTNTPKPT
jgi:hypothetical protein